MQHMTGELFKMMTGIGMVHVPYRGGAPGLSDLLAGQVQVMFEFMATTIPHVRSGGLRPSPSRVRCVGRNSPTRRR
jgi:tripartite-type tricarboxylate transporter receptor subunit TctC